MIGNIDNLLNLKNDIFQKKDLKPLFLQISAVAQYLWDRGWAERNAGNFSVNVTHLFQEKELDRLSTYPFYPLSRHYPDLARKLFLISGTGTRMRDLASNPLENICFVYISDSGSAFHIIDDHRDEPAVKPTSELATHLAVQQQFIHRKSPEKVVLHAHVTELVALTQLPQFTSGEAINSLLWGMHPETVLFLPDGAGFIPFRQPGSETIAMASIREFEKHAVVIWEKHGCLAVGSTMAEAFDYLDLLAKAARIWFMCKSAGFDPEGLTPAQVAEIRRSVS